MKYSLEVLHREPVGKKTGKTLLFIHGVGHGAWCWEKYMCVGTVAAKGTCF